MSIKKKNTAFKAIKFNEPYLTGKEQEYVAKAISSGHIKGNGAYTAQCQKWIESKLGSPKALLTSSCTSALEMAALLGNIQAGDEVILPSFTFVSTANAFVLRGAKPVFVDVRRDTLNIDENLIEEKITPKTKAICVIHYAGVACEMDAIKAIADKHHLLIIEDAAQGVMSKYKGSYLGTLGDFGTYSFHETKNYSSGEGGAILMNNPSYIEQSEIVWEMGTNRNQFLRGEVDKYSWVAVGSSFLPSEIQAAFLLAQFESATEINDKRLSLWNQYHNGLKGLATNGWITQPTVPEGCEHNGHTYYFLMEKIEDRNKLIAYMKAKGVAASFHYAPLHLAKMGAFYGYRKGDFLITEEVSESIVRLPLHLNLSSVEVSRVIEMVKAYFKIEY